MRVRKASLLFFIFLLITTTNAHAGLFGEKKQPQSKPTEEKPKCELLLVEAVKTSANPELNYQLLAQLRSEAFVRTIQQKAEGLGASVSQRIYLNNYLADIPDLKESFANVLNASIVGFERHGYRSAAYTEKGLMEEDGVIYEIFHPGDKTSYIVISRGGDTLEGFDMDAFADGDLKVGRLQGQMEDLSAISIEIVTEEEGGAVKGHRFTTMPNQGPELKHWGFTQTKEQWIQWLGNRLAVAIQENKVQEHPTQWFGDGYMKDEEGAP